MALQSEFDEFCQQFLYTRHLPKKANFLFQIARENAQIRRVRKTKFLQANSGVIL